MVVVRRLVLTIDIDFPTPDLVHSRQEYTLQCTVLESDKQRPIETSIWSDSDSSDIPAGIVWWARAEGIRALKDNVGCDAGYGGRHEEVGVDDVTGCDEESRWINGEQGLQFSVPGAGERACGELVLAPGGVCEDGVFELFVRGPGREGFGEGVGRAGGVAGEVGPAVVVDLGEGVSRSWR